MRGPGQEFRELVTSLRGRVKWKKMQRTRQENGELEAVPHQTGTSLYVVTTLLVFIFCLLLTWELWLSNRTVNPQREAPQVRS